MMTNDDIFPGIGHGIGRPHAPDNARLLQVPGPTNVPERVLAAMHRPAMDPTGPEFRKLAQDCFARLKPFFRMDDEGGAGGEDGAVFMYAANGHGVWEAALVNALSPGDKVLVPDTGNFAFAWRRMAVSLGLDAEYLEGDWRHALDTAAVEARLREDTRHEIKAVLAVHTDTSTSVTSDIAALRAAIDTAGHPAMLMLDAIASHMTVDVPMGAWGVDVLISASQKGFMCPPGLGFLAANARALKASESSGYYRNYWDWRLRLEDPTYRWFCGTAPQHLLFGLLEAMDMLDEEGLGAVYARHARCAGMVRAAVEHWGQDGPLELNAVEPADRANSVTTIRIPAELDPDALRARCLARTGIAIGGGLARLKGNAVRIGHMGYVTEPMIAATLAAFEATLAEDGIPHRPGAVAAAQRFITK